MLPNDGSTPAPTSSLPGSNAAPLPNLERMSTPELEAVLGETLAGMGIPPESAGLPPGAMPVTPGMPLGGAPVAGGPGPMPGAPPQGPALPPDAGVGLPAVEPTEIAAAADTLYNAGMLTTPTQSVTPELVTALDKVTQAFAPGLFDMNNPADLAEAIRGVANGTIPAAPAGPAPGPAAGLPAAPGGAGGIPPELGAALAGLVGGAGAPGGPAPGGIPGL